MSLNFDEVIQDMGAAVIGQLTNATVTYRKGDDALSDRIISAHCRYRNEEPKDGKTRARYPTPQLSVINDASKGIASSEIDTGGDLVLIAPRPGLMAKWMRITRILTQNGGWLTMELQ